MKQSSFIAINKLSSPTAAWRSGKVMKAMLEEELIKAGCRYSDKKVRAKDLP